MGSEWMATMLIVPHTRTTSVMALTAAGMAGDLEGHVHAVPIGPLVGEADRIDAGADDLEAQAPEHLDPERVDLGHGDPGAPVAADQGDQAADRAAAEHEDGVAGLHPGPRDVVRRDGQGLDDGGVVVRQGVGHLDEPVDGHRPVLLHPAREVDAQDLQVVADVAGADPARPARPAEPDGLHHDAVARREAAAGGGLDDLRERLVADDPALRDPVVQVALEDVEVRAADADPQDAEESLAGTSRGDRGLARGEGSRALVEDRAHRARGCHGTSWMAGRPSGSSRCGGGDACRPPRRACVRVVRRPGSAAAELLADQARARGERPDLAVAHVRGLQPKPQSGLT